MAPFTFRDGVEWQIEAEVGDVSVDADRGEEFVAEVAKLFELSIEPKSGPPLASEFVVAHTKEPVRWAVRRSTLTGNVFVSTSGGDVPYYILIHTKLVRDWSKRPSFSNQS